MTLGTSTQKKKQFLYPDHPASDCLTRAETDTEVLSTIYIFPHPSTQKYTYSKKSVVQGGYFFLCPLKVVTHMKTNGSVSDG